MFNRFFWGRFSSWCGFCVIIVLLPVRVSGQSTWAWAQGAGAGSDQRGLAITADVNGNSFSTGYIIGSNNDFGSNLISSVGGDDIFIAKYDLNGNNVWVRRAGGAGDDFGHGIATDASGNIYVCGEFQGTATFLGSPNIVLTSTGNADMFVAKYNAAGDVLWAKKGGSVGNDRGHDITTNGTNVFVAGSFQSSITFGSLGALSSAGGDDVFIVSYNASTGAENWAVRGGSVAEDHADGIAVDASGVYVSGHYDATCSFQNHAGSLANNGSSDIFLVKYNLSGTTGLWQRRAGGFGDDEATSIAVNGSFVYVGGFFTGIMSLYNTGPAVATINNTAGDDACLIQYDATSGNYSWVRSENGTADDRIYGISANPQGTVYTTGYFEGTLPMGSLPSVTANNRDIFVTMYSSAGVFLDGQVGTGSSDEEGFGISAPDNFSAYVTGYVKSSTAVFGSHSVGSVSNEDICFAKLECTVVTSDAGPNQTVCATTATLAGNSAGPGTGTWTLISGTGTITSANSPTSGVTGLGAGPNVFRWSIVSGACGPTTDDVTITRDVNPTTSAAGPDQNVCVSTATLAGNAAVVGAGVWTLITGAGTITTPSSPASGITGLGVGPNVFQWTITNGTCPSSTDQVTITRDANPTTSNAGSDQTICSSTATLAGNVATTGNGVWTLISGTGTVTTPSSPTSGVTGLSVGPNVFEWTISNGTCPSSSDQVTITVDPNPTTSNAGSDQTICSSSAAFAGNTATVGSGAWTLITGTGTITTPSSPTSGVTGLSVGPNVFQWTITNGVCPSSSDQVTITVDPNPTVSNAGSDQTICSSSATLAGNVATTGNGVWTLISGTGTVTTPSSPTSGVTGLSVGANVFEWTISNGTCPSSADQVTITVDPNPTISNAGSDQTICSSSTMLAGNTPTIGAGVWTLISGTGNFANALSATTAVTGLSIGANVFEWTITNGTCPSSSDQVTINVDANPTTASAGSNQTICSSSTTFAGNIPATGTGLWTLISGAGTIANASSPTSGVTGLGVGANIFEWTISNGVCPSSSSQVTITQDANPSTANAGTDITICAGSDSLIGNVPVTGSGMWTLISGSGTITSSSSPSTSVLALGTGINEFQWTITNGVCPSSQDTVTIEVDAMPTIANAGADQVICSSSTVLAGNNITTGTGMWALVSGTGLITNPALPNSTVTGMSAGVNIFEWRSGNGICPTSSDTVMITVDQNPTTANAGTDTALCSSSYTFFANTATIGTGNWTLLSGSGVIANPTSPVSAVTALGTGTNIFSWTITNGTCPASSDQVTVFRDALPDVAAAGTDHNRCVPLDTLNGNVPLTGTGLWTIIYGGANLISSTSPTSAVNNLTPGANIFEWKISNGSCPSSSDTVQINYNEAPSAAVAGADILACDDTVALQAQTPLVGSGVWDPLGGSPLIADSTNPNATIPGLSAGSWQYAWTVTNGFCVSQTDTVGVTVYDAPTVAAAGDDQLIHIASAALNAEPVSIGIGTWTFIQGSGTIEDIHDPFTRVTDLSSGVNILRWTTSNGVCAESSDDVRIESLPLIVPEGYSPNGDGVNDEFEITGLLEYTAVSLEVFNRWGNVVFVSSDYRNNWNGTGENGQLLPDDVYYYILRVDEGTVFTGYVAIKRSVQ